MLATLFCALWPTAFAAVWASAIALPGGPPVGMDYLAYDAAHGRVWAPAGNSGAVDVLDVATGKVTAVRGFPTARSSRPGRPDVGPSSAAVAGATVWIGNRADHSVCAVDAVTLARGGCLALPASPDGLAWVATTGELWVTTPAAHALTIVNVAGKTPRLGGTIPLAGDPEGYAVDAGRGIFYTNLEDHDRALAFDVRTRKLIGDWPVGCGAAGPRGVALDGALRLLFVACTDGAVALDLGHGGRAAGRLHTGAGVDNIDYAPALRLLAVASGAAGALTFAAVDPRGGLTPSGTAPTAPGVRCVVVDSKGTAYAADSRGGRLLVIPPPVPPR